MGFSVVRDHEGQQHGSSCGIVAAHISAALKEARDHFMTATTTDATQWHVIEAANINALRRPPFDTSVTTGHEVEEAADYFNRGPSILFRESAVRTHNGDTEAEAAVRLVSEEGDSMHTRFLQSPQAYDSFLTSVARDVRDARINRTPIKRFHVPNTDDSTGLGFHWVSAVYEIKQKRV